MQLTTLYTTITERLPNLDEEVREIIITKIADRLYQKLVGELEPEKQESLDVLISDGLTDTELIDYFQSMPHFNELLQSVTDETISNYTQNPA